MQVRNTRWTPGVAVLLAASAGFVDVVGYLTLHRVFTAHMTGNASKLGVALGEGHLGRAAPFIVVPFLWTSGVAAGTVLVDAFGRAVPLACQAALVCAYMGYGSTVVRGNSVPDHTLAGFWVLLALAAFALGLQSAALTEVAGSRVRTTYVSGMLTNLTQTAVRRLRGRRDDRRSLRLLATACVAYVAGATLGSFGLRELTLWCLAIPAGAILLAAAAER